MKMISMLAAFAAVASATFVKTNGTHFEDPNIAGHYIQNFGCGTHHSHASSHFNATINRLYTAHSHSKAGSRKPKASTRRQTVPTPIAVNTYFHIISSTANNGTITPAMATQQLAELNTAYNPYGISFTLANTSWTVNDDWAVCADDPTMTALKTALRQGTYSDLNLYFHTDLAYLGAGNLGTCTLPSQVPAGSAPSVYVSDGCNVNANTMPTGNLGAYNLGKTAVHETGHWLGLLHTFEGYSCTGPGDLIADTPMEMTSTSGCPTSPMKNSCPSVSQGDPIHNYMDYSTDACYEAFTPDQVARMGSLWAEYRQGM